LKKRKKAQKSAIGAQYKFASNRKALGSGERLVFGFALLYVTK